MIVTVFRKALAIWNVGRLLKIALTLDIDGDVDVVTHHLVELTPFDNDISGAIENPCPGLRDAGH